MTKKKKPPPPPPHPEVQAAQEAHDQALAEMQRVHALVDEARMHRDEVRARHANPHDLVALAAAGDHYAVIRFDEVLRAMHPAIIGFGPKDANASANERYCETRDIQLLVRVPPEADEESLNSLAEAAREFVNIYVKTLNDPRVEQRGGHQNFAHIKTQGCSLFFRRPSRKNPYVEAFIEVNRVREQEGTLEAMLALTPHYDMLAALGRG